VFTNVYDILVDEDALINLSFKVTTSPDRTYSILIHKKDCSFEESNEFEGIYKVSCEKELSAYEPFASGIDYDPKNSRTYKRVR